MGLNVLYKPIPDPQASCNRFSLGYFSLHPNKWLPASITLRKDHFTPFKNDSQFLFFFNISRTYFSKHILWIPDLLFWKLKKYVPGEYSGMIFRLPYSLFRKHILFTELIPEIPFAYFGYCIECMGAERKCRGAGIFSYLGCENQHPLVCWITNICWAIISFTSISVSYTHLTLPTNREV